MGRRSARRCSVSDEPIRPFVFHDDGRIGVHAPPVGRFVISPSGHIWSRYEPGCPPVWRELVKVTVVGALAAMRKGHLLVHGATVCAPSGDEAFVVLGSSGAGKSTTAAALGRLGCAVVADDAAAIDVSGHAVALGPRAIHRVTPASIQLLDIAADEVVVAPEAGGKALLVAAPHRRNAPQVTTLVFMTPGDGPVRTMRREATVERLLGSLYWTGVLDRLGLRHQQLEMALRLATRCRLLEVPIGDPRLSPLYLAERLLLGTAR
jgi:hypothetical protein